MDTVSFINSIGCSNFEQTVTNFFDETMAMYNLIGKCNYANINGEINGGSSITFNLSFNSEKDSQKMLEQIPSCITIFDRVFLTNTEEQQSNIKVNLTDITEKVSRIP